MENNINTDIPEEQETVCNEETEQEHQPPETVEKQEAIPNFNPNAQSYQEETYEQPEHGKAVAGFVLSLVGICCCSICSIIGLVFGKQAKDAGNEEGICKAAIILSIIGLALWAVGIIVGLTTGMMTSYLSKIGI